MGKITLKARKGREGEPDDRMLWDDIDSDIDDEWQQFMHDLFPELAGKEPTEEKGGPGSGDFGHAGRPGKVGGSASGKSSGSTSEEAFAFVKRLTLTGGDIGNIELSDAAREYLSQTVAKDSYKLYRGIGLIRSRYDLDKAKKLRVGETVPDDLMKKGNNYASYTSKKSVARYYSEGKISLMTEATVAKNSIIVDTRNLHKLPDASKYFDSSDFEYFKDEAEVIVQEPISAVVSSIKW